MTRLTILGATLIAGVVALFASATASAQYGPIGFSQFCAASTTNAQINTSVTVQVVITDGFGSPVNGQLVGFFISSLPPGSNASLSSNAAFTNLFGIASVTLFTGSTLGTIVVNGGCTAVVNVQGLALVQAAVVQPTAQVQGVAVIQLPSTGDAGLATSQSGFSSGTTMVFLAAAALVLTLGGSATAILVRARKSRTRA